MKLKLKTFNTTNVQNSREQKPYIQVNSKTGLFNINNAACEEMGLKDKDQVQFHQSEDEPSDWFLEKVESDGFAIRGKEGAPGNFFNSTKLIRMIFDSIAFTGESGRIYIGEKVKHEKTELFTLITAKLVNE